MSASHRCEGACKRRRRKPSKDADSKYAVVERKSPVGIRKEAESREEESCGNPSTNAMLHARKEAESRGKMLRKDVVDSCRKRKKSGRHAVIAARESLIDVAVRHCSPFVGRMGQHARGFELRQWVHGARRRRGPPPRRRGIGFLLDPALRAFLGASFGTAFRAPAGKKARAGLFLKQAVLRILPHSLTLCNL
jgi:hypothetical protein